MKFTQISTKNGSKIYIEVKTRSIWGINTSDLWVAIEEGDARNLAGLWIENDLLKDLLKFFQEITCEQCKGTGMQSDKLCESCGGTGVCTYE